MLRAACAALLFIVLGGLRAQAQPGSIKLSGSPATMAIRSTAAAGQPPASVTDATSTYQVKALAGGAVAKVTAQLNAAMPAEMTLTISMTENSSATSLGPIALDTTPRDVLTGIASNTSGTITYSLSATAAAGVVTLQSRSVTLTVTASP